MRQVFCLNILDFLPCAKLIILYLFVGSFKFIFKQLQYFGGGLIEGSYVAAAQSRNVSEQSNSSIRSTQAHIH